MPVKKKRTRKKANLKRRIKPELYFKLLPGEELRNVKELAEALEKMSEEVFRHHVNAERNDFANWIRDVFYDVELAELMEHQRTKEGMRITIYKHVTKKYFKERK